MHAIPGKERRVFPARLGLMFAHAVFRGDTTCLSEKSLGHVLYTVIPAFCII